MPSLMRNRPNNRGDDVTREARQAPPLSAAWKKEIERRVKDSVDPRRYIIKSVLLPNRRKPWVLYYNVSDDVWAMDISHATLFKRRRAAKAIAELLGDRFNIEEVKVAKTGRISRQHKKTTRT